MPSVYVYAPVSGTITGLDNYCNGTPHRPCRNVQPSQVSPVDIGTGGNMRKIYLYASRVSKVYISTQYRCCCGQNGIYGRTRIIALYSSEGCYVGSVWFGHIDYIPWNDPDKPLEAQDGWNVYNGPLLLGRTPGNNCCAPCGCTSGCCYIAVHTHMERDGGISVAPPCGTPVTAGTTPIYRFDYSTPCPTGFTM